jgi:antitoxin component YwqK of YwqJK toxin-antitoxin module
MSSPLINIIVILFSSFIFAQDMNQFDEKGLRHGPWNGYYNETKNLKYEGTFAHGKEVGTFIFYDNTKKKEIIAKRDFNDKGEAYTTFFKGKFKVSEGLVVNQKYEGLWTTYHKDSSIPMMKEIYKNGVLEGEKKVYYHDGDLVEESYYKNGKRHGKYKKYALSGKVIEEIEYVDGKMHGPAIFRDYQGEVVLEGQYKDDFQVGLWKHYKKGKVDKIENKDAQKTYKRSAENAPLSAEKKPTKKREVIRDKKQKKP